MTTETKTRTGGVLAATCLSTLVVNANTSAVSILLPAISEDTGMSVDTLQWAVTGYSLVGAAVIVTSGSLGDVFGRKRVFQLGLALFVVSCVLIALANTGGVVIAGRMIQGAAGATILACGLSLLSVANTGQAQLRAVSLWGAAAAVGAAAGPLVGGVLVEITGWQGLFWIDAGVAVLCMVLTFFTVTESRDPNRPRSIDYAGTVLVALTLAPFILAVSKGGAWGWFSVATLACFAVAVASGFAFVAVERRVAVPMLDLAVLRNRVLVGATIAILIGAGTINGLMYLLSLYFQDPSTLGFSPLQAGLATLPATVGLVVIAPLVPKLAARFGGRQVIGVGFAITAGGFAADRFRPAFLALSGLSAASGRNRRRNGNVQRARLLCGNGFSLRRASRSGIRCFEHGPLCRRGGGNRAGGDDLRHRDGKPDRGGRDHFGGPLGRLGIGVVGDGGVQLRRCSHGLRDGSPPCGQGNSGRLRRSRGGPYAHSPDIRNSRTRAGRRERIAISSRTQQRC